MIEIKNRFTGEVMISGDYETLMELLVNSVKEKKNLSGANLSRANLSGANLSGADFSGADFYGANLSGADFSGANLSVADLSFANLSGADFSGANLSDANLSRANLYGADFSGANLYGVKNSELAISKTSIVPDFGSFCGWKKCSDGIIVQLEIPAEARRSNASGRKCRAEFAKVLQVIGADVAYSTKYAKIILVYRVGETVRCDKWEENRFIECGGGIHFYITKIEAENH